MKIKVKSLDVDQALQILDALGSSQDPIIFYSKEITPEDLSYGHHCIGDNPITDNTSASKVCIKFWGYGTDNNFKLRTGSLYTMVVDRLNRD